MFEKFNSPYNPKETESRIYEMWEKSGYFTPEAHQPRADNPKSYQTFTVVIPPPNVTGSLHMGHALNATIQDILVRKKRMEGYKTLWLPGTDHAGIATQNVVEKKLQKEGISRHQLGREKFLEKVWEWKEEYGNKILGQLKKIGASCDWSRTRFTMDEDYKKAVEKAFLEYYNEGLIYQGERVINWCKRCQTSLSDLEVEYDEEKGVLHYIKYFFKDAPSEYVVVATTRPETMLGDTAVAVNSDDERYKDFIGKTLILPVINREIPIIADDSIDKDFGTGAVKVTPNHSIVDSDIADRHKLPRVTIINQLGKMTAEAGKEFEGLSTKDARDKIILKLKESGFLEKTEDYIHRVSKCYRCNSAIEPQPSKQWFLKMDGLAKKAKETVESGKVKFNDERWKKIYLDWMSNIKDWCISRQIWWGHQIPVFFCEKKREFELKVKNEKLKVEENFIVSGKKPEKCPFCGKCEMKQSEDVLDTWFSSALWPFATLGWPASVKTTAGKTELTGDLKEFYPTQVLSTARDIINLWVGRMIFSGVKFMGGQAPFSDVLVHPTVLAKSGQRMSKSLGTGVDPLILIEKYGADATRFGLTYQMMGGQDMKFDESHLLAGKKFCNKIWNAARYVLANMPPRIDADLKRGLTPIKNLTAADEKILKEFKAAAEEVNKNLDKYEFGQALHSLYDFFWHRFCDVYLEASKAQLADPKQAENTQRILLYVLADSLKFLHPFMPFITEEIWSELFTRRSFSAGGGSPPASQARALRAGTSGGSEGGPFKDKNLLIIESWPKSGM